MKARLERVPADPATARVFLKRAESVLADARAPSLSPISRQLLNWQACVSAMDAALLVAGQRVAGSEGGHQLRISATEDSMDGDHGDLFERLNGHRELRNEASYAIGIVSEGEAESLRAAATDLITAVRRMLGCS